MNIKFESKEQFQNITDFYTGIGYHTEYKHDVSDLGVIYVNNAYDSLHVSSVGYADLKQHSYMQYDAWLLYVLKILVKKEDNHE